MGARHGFAGMFRFGFGRFDLGTTWMESRRNIEHYMKTGELAKEGIADFHASAVFFSFLLSLSFKQHNATQT